MLNSKIRVIEQLAFGHDGTRLYAAGSKLSKLRGRKDNRGVDVWTVPGGPEPIQHLLTESTVGGICLNLAGRWLYAAARPPGAERPTYHAVDLVNGTAVSLDLGADFEFEVAVLQGGTAFLASGYVKGHDDKAVTRWKQPADRAPVREWLKTPPEGNEPLASLAFDRTRNRIVTLNLGRTEDRDYTYELSTFDTANWKLLGRVRISNKIAYWDQLLFHPADTCLVLRSRKTIYVWDAADLTLEPKRIAYSKNEFTDLAFHPTGRWLAATSNDTTVKLYDTSSWQLAKTYTWNIGRLRSVAFSPDGMLAAAGSDTGRIVVWDVEE